MAKFTYVASDAGGVETKGTVEAPDQTGAVGMIREKGLFPTDVAIATAPGKVVKSRSSSSKERGAKKGGATFLGMEVGSFDSFGGGGKPKTKHLMSFTRQLATLLNAGMPLVRGLKVLERQEKNVKLSRAIGEVGESIESGTHFAEALSHHPKIFNKLYVNMVTAGEVGGILDAVLDQLAVFMEKAEKIRGKVKSAMAYPVVVLVMATAILIFLLIFIIPKFESIFADMLGDDKGLPVLTQVVIGMSRGLMDKWLVVLIVVVSMVFGFRLFKATAKGRYVVDACVLYIPMFGPMLRKTAVARFARTLGVLMNAGVPVLQALNIVRDTSTNEVVARAVHVVHDSVKEGESMAGPMEATGAFPPIVTSMIEVGEETGTVADMLIKIADNYEDEVDNAVAGITSVIEPILIVLLALIVGAIVIAMFLPLISIISDLSGG